MGTIDTIKKLGTVVSIKFLGSAFFLFPLATSIFLLLNQNTGLHLIFLIVTALILALLLAINYFGTETINKADGQVSFSRTWEYSFWKKSPLVLGLFQTILCIISTYYLLSFLTTLDGILLFIYGVMGYTISLIFGYMKKDVSLWALVIQMSRDMQEKRARKV